MKKSVRVFAMLLTVCLLCGVIFTAAFATSDGGSSDFSHPTLTLSASDSATGKIVDWLSENFEGKTVGDTAANVSAKINFVRFANSAISYEEQTVAGGYSNKYLRFESPTDSNNNFWKTTANGWNERSSYFQAMFNSAYLKPVNYLGLYDADALDNKTPVTNSFDYLVYDFDLAAMAYRLQYTNSEYARADRITVSDDGTVTAVLDDGTVVVTNSEKTKTVSTAPSGVITKTEKFAIGTLVTVTQLDGSYVTSLYNKSNDGVITMTQSSYSALGALLSATSAVKSAVAADKSYTITYYNGDTVVKTVSYAAPVVTDVTVTNDGTSYTRTDTTEVITVVEGDTTTVYTTITGMKSSAIVTLSQTKTVNGESVGVNTYAWKKSDASYSIRYAQYETELASLLAVSDAAVSGAHIKDYRLAYTPLSIYPTLRYGKNGTVVATEKDGVTTYSTSAATLATSKYVYLYLTYYNSQWVLSTRSNPTASSHVVATLSDKVGEWNHISLLIETNTSNWKGTKVSYLFNGEVVETQTIPSAEADFVGLEDLRFTTSAIMPGDVNYYSFAIDNMSTKVYEPKLNEIKTEKTDIEGKTYTEITYERIPYDSGTDNGIEDFKAGTGSFDNLNDLSDTVYTTEYCQANQYASIDGGKKIFNPDEAVAAINAGVKNGSTVVTTMSLRGLTIPAGVDYYSIVCDADDVSVTLAANAGDGVVVLRDANGYDIARKNTIQVADKLSNYNHLYDFEDKSTGAFSDNFGNGSGNAGTYSSTTVVSKAGNKYLRFAHKADASDRYRRDFLMANYKTTSDGTRLSNYAYYTLDFDVAADKYVYKLDGVEMMSEFVPDGATDVKLAYKDTMNFAIDNRPLYSVKGADGSVSYSTADVSGYSALTVKFIYEDGAWQLYVSDKKTGYTLSDTLGEWNHFTYAVQVINTNVGTEEAPVYTYGYSKLRLYFNGILVGSTNINTNGTWVKKCEDIVPRGIDWYDSVKTKKAGTYTSEKFSVAIDNFAANYYTKGYESAANEYGIDNLFNDADTKKSITLCSDVLYNENYYFKTLSYVQLNDEEPVFIPIGYDAVIADIQSGDVLSTSADLRETSVANGSMPFAVNILGSGRFSIAKELQSTYLAIKDGSGYLVRPVTDDDKITVIWKDKNGNQLGSELLLPYTEPNSSAYNLSVYDPATHTADALIGWYWDLDGEGSEYGAALISMFTADDIGKISKTVIATPKIESTKLPDTFVSYYYDESGARRLAHSVEAYSSMDNLATVVNTAPYGAYIVLMYEGIYDLPMQTALDIPAGQKLYFDMNGRILIHSYGTSYEYDGGLFKLREGTWLNLYSSKPGAMIFEAAEPASNTMYSTGGIINVHSSVDECTVYLGDKVDANGNVTDKFGDNLTFNAGSAVRVNGPITAEEAAKRINENKIKININGGFYYSSIRPSYAIIVSLAPDVVVTINDATFYSTMINYSIFHDYADTTSADYTSRMQISAYNTTFVAKPDVSVDYPVKFYFTMSADSSVYLEGCTLIGNLGGLNSNVKYGAGNVIATNKTSYFGAGKYTLDTGVNALRINESSSYVVSKTLTHSPLVNDVSFMLKDEDGKYYLDPSCADVNNFITETISLPVTFVTFTENSVPEFIKSVEWKDNSGASLGSNYAFIGDIPTVIKPISEVAPSVTYDWYVKSYAWINSATGTERVGDSENVFAPMAQYEAKIVGMQQNATLFTDMTYNVYLPISENVSNVLVSGADLANETYEYKGVTYYVISTTPAINDFAAKTATVSFMTADGVALDFVVSLDVIKYADAVAKAYSCGSKESTLVYEMISYKAAVAKYVDSSFEAPAELLAFNASHKDCACASTEVEISDQEKNVNYSALVGKVLGVGYALDLNEMGMKIVVADGVEVTSVTYKDARGREYTHTVEAGNLIKKNGYYLAVGISAAYIDNIMTINVGDLSGTYCLGKFITDNPTVDIAKSVYKYAVAAEAYKVTKQ